MATYRKVELDDIEPLRSVREQIPVNHDQHLRNQQQRNHRLQELRSEKKETVRTKERQEQGFSLYFSGANSGKRHKESKLPVEEHDCSKGGHTQRKAKTSTGDRLSSDIFWDESNKRMKTAPNSSRKGWGDGNRVKIKTQGYGILQAKAPDAYSEDFEQLGDCDDVNLNRVSLHSSNSSIDEDISTNLVDKVTLSIDDVRQLRKSLMQFNVSEIINEELECVEAEDAAVMDDIQDITDEEIKLDDLNSKSTIVLEFQHQGMAPRDIKTLTTAHVKASPNLKMEEIDDAVSAVQRENKERLTELKGDSPSNNKHVELNQNEGIDDSVPPGSRENKKILEESASGDQISENAVDRFQYIVDHVKELSTMQQQKLIEVLTNIESTIQVHTSEDKDTVSSIKLELKSNWGHPTKIGLTEIQLFDADGKKIQATSIVDCKEVENSIMLSNLCNGKFKTTKERNMWSSTFIATQSIDILLKYPTSSKLSKIVIWNYNKSIQDLDIGVRECKITVDNRSVFDGDLIKGGGNQVFDCSTTIMLDINYSSNQTIVQSSIVGNSLKDFEPNPVNVKTASPITIHDHEATASGSSINDQLDTMHKSSSDHLLSAAALYKSQESAHRHTPRSLRTSQSRKIISPQRSTSSKSPSKIPPLTVSLENPESSKPIRTEEMTCSTDDDCLINKLKECKKIRASRTPNWLAEQEQPLSKEPLRSRNMKSDDLLAESNEGRLTPMQKITAAREKRIKSKENVLEQSWTSLNFFNRSEAGRISTGFENDALDSCLAALNQPNNKQSMYHPVPIEEETQRSLEKEDYVLSEDDFFIPELPEGEELIINIKSTWGDCHYVGLTGIEIFSDCGEPIKIKSIEANPSDINILSDYGNDPRIVTNLVDGINKTRDDVHMWLTPYTNGGNHWIYITFEKPCRLALMRFWNYNKSRIHSSRGARFIQVTLNNRFIFKGDIARACGVVSDSSCETILFTTDDNILEKVSCNDKAFIPIDNFSSDDTDSEQKNKHRPSTADTSEVETDDDPMLRPFTCAKLKKSINQINLSSTSGAGICTIKHLLLNFTASWGDPHYLGLTGLELLDPTGKAIDVSLDMIRAEPRDMTVLPNCKHDSRTIDKLINNNNLTTSDEQMWMIPFTDGDSHTIEISFSQTTAISGIRLWNYNKSPEDAYRGAKIMHVSGDSQPLSPNQGYLLRKAPGHFHFDFKQEFLFSEKEKYSSATASLGSDSNLPCGFIYQLNLFCAWNDQYYVGLNGMECFDNLNKKLELTKPNIAAFPESINVLQNNGTTTDVRTPEKIIDGVNDTTDGRHMWLAPILPGVLNKIFIIFDYPVSLSMVRLWNYSKTPKRGVKDFSVLVDDLLIYSGSLPCVNPGARGILPTCTGSQPHHTVLFSNNDESLHIERNAVLQSEAQDQDVMLTNDHQIMTHYSKPQLPPDQNLRPTTSVPSRATKYLRHCDQRF